MEEPALTVREQPGLVAWLKTNLWQRSFGRGAVSRATEYANEREVNFSDVNRINGDSVVFEAKIRGSRANHYHTRVGFFSTTKSWSVYAECSCPVGLFCKHGAAIILLLLDQLDPLQRRAPAKTAALEPLDPHVKLWLEELHRASHAAQVAPKPPAEERRFLAFCFEPLADYQQSESWFFTLRVGTRHKNREDFSISETLAAADPSRPPKYMVREDFLPASLYHQRKRKMACWGEMPLREGDWDALLESALATGRCYLAGTKMDHWIPVLAGPDLPVEAGWLTSPDGNAVAKLDFQDGRPRIVLPTRPPRYLDPESGHLGLICSELAPHLLQAWITAPPIPERQIKILSKQLHLLAPELPPPVAMETIALPEVPPTPHLRVSKGDFGPYGELIYGILRYRYADGPALDPLKKLDSPVSHQIRGSKRYLQRRDAEAEIAAEAQLRDLGFSSLSLLLPPYLLGPESYRAVIPDSVHFDRENQIDAWIELLHGPAIASLRDQGWTLEIDPSAGLVLHDAGGFFPHIESDPDHGIDWFRFDAEFELDGRRVSLIPIIAQAIDRNLPAADSPDLPEFYIFPCEDPNDGAIRFPARQLMEIVDQVRHLFQGRVVDGPVRIDRLGAAGVASALALDSSETLRSLARLADNLKQIHSLPEIALPEKLNARLRGYQEEGFRWLQFLAANSLHGILADDMGLGKTVQTLAHLAAEAAKRPGTPSLVIAPTSVVPNWSAEAAKFTPQLEVVTLHGKERHQDFSHIAAADVVITSYPLLVRDFKILAAQDWHNIVLDEAQSIKNPKAIVAQNACKLKAAHRFCLSGTPMENHLGELWSLMRFLMPGFLGDEKTFNLHLRRPIERDRSREAQLTLNRRVSPLILRRTKDQVATELPPKTELIHPIELTKKQTDLYESVRAAMDKRVRDAISNKGLAKSHIIVLDALLKLRQICCHPQLLKTAAAQKVSDSAKLDYLTDNLLPTLLEEGRRILLFSSFTSMLELIGKQLEKAAIPFLKLTGQTQNRASLVNQFQSGEVPIFLISLKAGGTGLNLTAADTVIHYDPWWNPAAENQATDRAHRIGQTKPVFVHKLVCRGTIEDRILELQKHKAALVEALLSDETTKLKIDPETLSHLLAPLGP
jgi:ERCC4-related helicase